MTCRRSRKIDTRRALNLSANQGNLGAANVMWFNITTYMPVVFVALSVAHMRSSS